MAADAYARHVVEQRRVPDGMLAASHVRANQPGEKYMKIQRMPLVLLGAIVAVAIAAVGSYYGFFAHNDGVQKHGLPSFAVGAETVIQVGYFPGQPDDYSNVFDRSDVVVEGVINELLPAKWTTTDAGPPEEITPEVMKDIDTHIRTTAVLDVETVYKGESIGETLNFSFIGGRVDDTAYVVEWNEGFTESARVILFLGQGEAGAPAKMVDSQGLAPRMYLLVEEDGSIKGPIQEVDRETFLQQIQPNSNHGR